MCWNTFIIQFLLGTLTVVSSTCPNGWTTFNGNCYSFVTSKENWFHAAKACRDQGSRLVDMQSDDEKEFIRSTIKHLHAHDDPETIAYWTSGNDLDVEGNFVWGYPEVSPMTYTDWFPGEPNNIWFDKREEDCVVLWGHAAHAYHWNDQPCDIADFYICKREDETEPSTIVG